MENTSITPLQEFQNQQQALIVLCTRLSLVLEGLNMPTLYAEARSLEQRICTQSLKILVTGEQGRGKSTVINALLGQKLLPAYPIPTTALRCEIRSGKQSQAILHYRPSPDGLSRQPRIVPDAEFEPLLIADSNQEDHTDHEWLEVLSPLPSLGSGIEFIDTAAPFSVSPYDDDGSQEVLLPDMPSVDAILFVLGCDSLPTKEESLEIERIQYAGHKTIFYLCNRFDLVEPSSQELVKRRFTTHLSHFTLHPEQSIFFTNAKGALAGRIAGDLEQTTNSHMLAVEARLSHFLATVPGKEKLLRNVSELKDIVHIASRLLAGKSLLLHSELQELRTRQVQADRRIEQLDKIRQRIFMLMNTVRQPMCTEIGVIAIHFYLNAADKIEAWTQEFTLAQPQSVWDIYTGDSGRRLVKELTAFLTEAVQREFQVWTISVLQEMLYKGPQATECLLQRQLHLFVNDIADMLPEVYSTGVTGKKDGTRQLFERLIAPFNNMLAFSEDIATLVAERENFTWHPIVLIAHILYNESVRAALKDRDRDGSLRDAVAQAYRHELEVSLGQRAAAIARIVDHRLGTLQEQLDHMLSLEIQCARDIINSGLVEQQLLKALDSELQAVRDELDTIWPSEATARP
jgi:Dynamin family